METTQHPQVAERPGAGSDDSLVSCLRAFPSPGRIQEGQDAEGLKEGFGQGSPGRHVRKRPGGWGLCSASLIGQKMELHRH